MKKIYLLFISIILFTFSYPITAQINRTDSEPSAPSNYVLYQNYPNPFNPTTTIRYALPANSFVTIKVFNSVGNEVKTLVNEEETAGYHKVVFDGKDFSSGVYFLQFESNNFLRVEKLVLLK